MPAHRDLEIYRGDRYSHEITIEAEQPDGSFAPLDMTGGVWRAQIRINEDSPEPLASFSVSVDDAAQGVLVLGLTADQTRILPAKCVYDVEDLTTQFTWQKGNISVEKDVSYV